MSRNLPRQNRQGFVAETIVRYRTVDVGGNKIFYREAGRKDAPALLLLHRYPTASDMFRDLIQLLADRFRLVAPDLPGFGQSDMPSRTKLHLYVRQFSSSHRPVCRHYRLITVCTLYFRLWRTCEIVDRPQSPRANHGNHLSERNAYEEGLSAGWNSPGNIGRNLPARGEKRFAAPLHRSRLCTNTCRVWWMPRWCRRMDYLSTTITLRVRMPTSCN